MGLLQKLFSSSGKPGSDSSRAPPKPEGAGVFPAASIAPGTRSECLAAEARLLDAEGRFGESLALVNQALTAAPNDFELLSAKGSTLYEWGRFWDAREVLLRANALAPDSTPLYMQLGWVCIALGDLPVADTWMRKAVRAEPDDWKPHHALGVLLQAAGRLDDALASLGSALERKPDHFDSVVLMGGCKLDQEKPAEAEAFFRRAIALDGNRADVLADLAVAVGRQGRIEEAREAMARAESLEATSGAELGDMAILGETFKEAGYLQDALNLYERRLPRWPTMAGHTNYAFALLTAGRLSEGWSHFEFRWLDEPFLSLRPRFDRPTWSGQDLTGKTILLRAEQGLGDTIQFLRYGRWLKLMGATVVLHVMKGLGGVARSCQGIDLVLEGGEALPAFDFYLHLMSLPRAFDTDLERIPADIPYLHPDPARLERWAGRLASRGPRLVGIAWAGDPIHRRDRHRSMSLEALAPLLGTAGVRFISLQKGAPVSELVTLAAGLDIVNLGPEFEDFADTAAVISQLDLVICVDTSVGHLAGALGKPVWMLIPEPADFRWLEAREDSPWYPTMRLFRQRQRGDWSEVVERVKWALGQWLAGDESVLQPRVEKRGAIGDDVVPPIVPNRGAAPGVRPGLCAVAETRLGILQYRPDSMPVGKSIDWYGEYLQPQLDLLTRLLRPGATVVEAGAGIGAHSVCLSAAIGAAGHLLAYEPEPLLQRILRQNLRANRAANVTVMRRRLGGPQATDAGAAPGDAPATETIDELQLEQLHLLKVNEGLACLEVLAGAAETLWRLRASLFIAAPDEATLIATTRQAKEFGYRCWRMETALFNAQNFNRRDNDIFAGRTALALLAIAEEIEVDVVLKHCSELR